MQRRNKTDNTIPSYRRFEYSYVRISVVTTKGIEKIIICPSNNTALVRKQFTRRFYIFIHLINKHKYTPIYFTFKKIIQEKKTVVNRFKKKIKGNYTNANMAKHGNIIYIIYNIQVCYKKHNIFAVIRGNGKSSTKTHAAFITYKYEGHLPRNNHTAVAYIGTLVLRFVNYA